MENRVLFSVIAAALCVSMESLASHSKCKVIKSRRGGAAADYKFEVPDADGKSFICVKEQTLNQNAQ
jgi:hypothetical protein